MATQTLTESKLAKLRGVRWSEAEAQEVLSAVEDSGSTIHAFALEHGLSPNKLYWWRDRLEGSDAAAGPEDVEQLSFAPVVVTGLGRRPTVIVRLGEIEIEVIEPSNVDPTWVAQLLAATKEGQ